MKKTSKNHIQGYAKETAIESLINKQKRYVEPLKRSFPTQKYFDFGEKEFSEEILAHNFGSKAT